MLPVLSRRYAKLLLWFFAVVAVWGLIILAFFMFKKPAASSATGEYTGKSAEVKTKISCQSDYCLHWVYGSCIGNGERYMERLCYDYPDIAESSSGCEAGKRIYYEKDSTNDGNC